MGADIFHEIWEECLKKIAPKNVSRGGDIFCTSRGGVEGEKGGTNQIFAEENRDFCENMRKKSKLF